MAATTCAKLSEDLVIVTRAFPVPRDLAWNALRRKIALAAKRNCRGGHSAGHQALSRVNAGMADLVACGL